MSVHVPGWTRYAPVGVQPTVRGPEGARISVLHTDSCALRPLQRQEACALVKAAWLPPYAAALRLHRAPRRHVSRKAVRQTCWDSGGIFLDPSGNVSCLIRTCSASPDCHRLGPQRRPRIEDVRAIRGRRSGIQNPPAAVCEDLPDGGIGLRQCGGSSLVQLAMSYRLGRADPFANISRMRRHRQKGCKEYAAQEFICHRIDTGQGCRTRCFRLGRSWGRRCEKRSKRHLSVRRSHLRHRVRRGQGRRLRLRPGEVRWPGKSWGYLRTAR
ncbi:hypothetical protein ACVWWJ_002464 [Luteibacter sp. HA06]